MYGTGVREVLGVLVVASIGFWAAVSGAFEVESRPDVSGAGTVRSTTTITVTPDAPGQPDRPDETATTREPSADAVETPTRVEVVDPSPPTVLSWDVAPTEISDFADPHVLRSSDGRYYAYGTQFVFLNVPLVVSDDLVTWTGLVDALPELPEWATWGRTWAPGAFEHDGRVVLWFAAEHTTSGLECIGAAVADGPAGPFVPVGTAPAVCELELGGSIDPYPFVDPSGQPWLTWKTDGNAIGVVSRIHVAALDPTGTRVAGPVTELLRRDAPWEWPLVENPALVPSENGVWLFLLGGPVGVLGLRHGARRVRVGHRTVREALGRRPLVRAGR